MPDLIYRYEDTDGDDFALYRRTANPGELFVEVPDGIYLPLSEVPALIAALSALLPEQPATETDRLRAQVDIYRQSALDRPATIPCTSRGCDYRILVRLADDPRHGWRRDLTGAWWCPECASLAPALDVAHVADANLTADA